ncbi:hypothetical protein MCUN1_000516 [Malassezia cuniculi]|uniref:Rhodanese domain-containing protein n=1 Tax=Malassezia cuniculi TaxID=948313 RepID=A0AAF0J503_9BASI|nr:hypothetical protein MCUN1_000516 [Malassezia cuniculi]
MLSPAEYARYGRQLILPDFGRHAQEQLKNARVLVVGHITIVDNDVVEVSNLARQILHNERRIGMPKAESIAEAVRDCEDGGVIGCITGLVGTMQATEAIRILAGSINIPMDDIRRDAQSVLADLQGHGPHITLLCRRGNDSREAVRRLSEAGGDEWAFDDVEGGLSAYTKLNPTFPMY